MANLESLQASMNITKARIERVESLISNKYSDVSFTVPIHETAKTARDFFLFTSIAPNAQAKSKDIEKFIIKMMGWKEVSASQDRGDAKDSTGRYFELKTSTTNKSENLNIRQIRLWQDVDEYVCSYINEDNVELSKCFRLTKEQMKAEVKRSGSPTHGTKNAASANTNIEYSLTISLGSAECKRWEKAYWDDILYKKLIQR